MRPRGAMKSSALVEPDEWISDDDPAGAAPLYVGKPWLSPGDGRRADMDPVRMLQLLSLLIVANGAPVVAKRLFGAAGARPVDGGARFCDGRPIFGAAKTWRGIMAAIVAATLLAPAFGLPAAAGAAIGAGAMAGDLFSSFVKRRLGRAVSSRALGLDQIPEALAPLLLLARTMTIDPLEIAIVTAGFLIGSLALSRLMFDLRVREQPF